MRKRTGSSPVTPIINIIGDDFIKEITYNNSRSVGNIGESVALCEFTKRRIPVFIPFGQNTPVDLLIYVNDKFLKIQVKTTQKIQDGHMQFELCRTNGFTFEKYPYTDKDTDYFFLYCIENDSSYLIDIDEVKNIQTVTLRLNKPKNNQTKGIRLAENYILHKQLDNILK